MPQGGLARRATLIDSTRAATAGPLLVLDAGNTLMGDSLSLQSDGRVTVDAFNQMGYDAVGVGTGELLKGIDILMERAADARFAVLSCNLVWIESGAPVVQPYLLLDRGGMRLAVIGVTNANALQGLESRSPGVQVLPPEETLARYIGDLRSQADVLVVLSHLGLEADRVLATTHEDIDVIVGGFSRRLLQEPETVGRTIIVQAGYDGEWLGSVTLGPVTPNATTDALPLAGHTLLTMWSDVSDDPDMVRLLDDYRRLYPEE